MIRSFKDFLVEEKKEVFFSLESMQPPTIGHGKLLEQLASKAKGAQYQVYLTQSTDSKNNPLGYKDKVKVVRKMFPQHARSIILDSKAKNVCDIAVRLYDSGVTKATMVVESDRVREFKTILERYNGVKGRHGFYNFERLNVVRMDSPELTESTMRGAVKSNDFTKFSQGLPKDFSNKESKALFNLVRKGLGLNEVTTFTNHIELEPISETREAYVSGDLFEIGDTVVVKETDELATVTHCGSNYLIVEEQSGAKTRKWLDAVEPVEDNFEEGKDPRDKLAKFLTKTTPSGAKVAPKHFTAKSAKETLRKIKNK